MHRIRRSISYFLECGWEPEIVTVDLSYIEAYSIDPLLDYSIPDNVTVHKVKAFDVNRTRKFGLGSLSIRSYFQFQKKGDELLGKGIFDLVYFTTTAFHVMALGPRWKKIFGVPFILDMQDPWRNDYYLDKPFQQRPPKYFLAHAIDKFLEAKTIPHADGIITVSSGLANILMSRYPSLQPSQFRIIPFGADPKDFAIADLHCAKVGKLKLRMDQKNIIYIGRGGHDLGFALEIIFNAFAKGLKQCREKYEDIHFWFIGTSYAQPGMGKQTIKPIADAMGLGTYVTEISDRLPFFETLSLLKRANLLLVPGSTDIAYTASKIYYYALAQKPLMAVFNRHCSVVNFLENVAYGKVVKFDNDPSQMNKYATNCFHAFEQIINSGYKPEVLNKRLFAPYTSQSRALEQVHFFEAVVNKQL